MKANYQLWTNLPYAGETKPPTNPDEPTAGFWPLYFFRLYKSGLVTDLIGNPIVLQIKNPNLIDWQKQLKTVQSTLQNLNQQQIELARYWGTGVASKQWTPVIDRLIDTYGLSAPRAARILAAVNASMNDAFVIVWYLKYKWLVARPNQLDSTLASILCTPRHPTYPSGHATISGCASVVLSYFFPGEKERLKRLAEECALSRLYAGVHFQADDDQGLRLGRQLGRLIVKHLRTQKYLRKSIDAIELPQKSTELPPPPYEQVIKFEFSAKCESLTRKD